MTSNNDHDTEKIVELLACYTEQLLVSLNFKLIMDAANQPNQWGDILWLERLDCIDVHLIETEISNEKRR